MIHQAKFTYSPLGKGLEKQTKTIGDKGKKQIDTLKLLKPDAQQLTIKDEIPEDQLSDEATNEIEEIKEIEKMVKGEKLFYEGEKGTYNFRQFDSIRSLLDIFLVIKVLEIMLMKIKLSYLFIEIKDLKKNSKTKKPREKE